MGLSFQEVTEKMDLFCSQLSERSIAKDISSLSTRVHGVSCKFLVKVRKNGIGNFGGKCKTCDYAKSYCDYPETSDEFWELMVKEAEEAIARSKGEKDMEEMTEIITEPPLVQSEEELIATCYAYCLSIPKRDDPLLECHLVKDIEKLQQKKGETLDTLQQFLQQKGIQIPFVDYMEKYSEELDRAQRDLLATKQEIYEQIRRCEILRLLALHRELVSQENKWILDNMEDHFRSSWKESHQSVLTGVIKDIVYSAFFSIRSNGEEYKELLYEKVWNGHVVVKIKYSHKDEEIDDNTCRMGVVKFCF